MPILVHACTIVYGWGRTTSPRFRHWNTATATSQVLAALPRATCRTPARIVYGPRGRVVRPRLRRRTLRDSNYTKPHKTAVKEDCSKPHRLEALEQAYPRRDDDSGLVFPSPTIPSRSLSDMTLTKILRATGLTERATVHGFRIGFKTLCIERTDALRAVGEAALAHTMGNSTEQAYARRDLFERRRALMEQWPDFVTAASGEEGRFPEAGPRERVWAITLEPALAISHVSSLWRAGGRPARR